MNLTLLYMYFTPKKIRLRFPTEKISEVLINIPRTIDSLNIPIKHGIQDIRLGPQISEPACTSCSASYFHCPGHFGSINFHSILLNPVLFKSLYTLVVSSCFSCHKFKISDFDREFLANIYKDDLLDAIKIHVRDRCPFCKLKRKAKKIHLKIMLDDVFIQPSELYLFMESMHEKEKEFFQRLDIDFRSFFIHKLFVLPNKFRPLSISSNKIFESPHNIHLAKIIKSNNLLHSEIESVLVNQHLQVINENSDNVNLKENHQTSTTTKNDQRISLVNDKITSQDGSKSFQNKGKNEKSYETFFKNQEKHLHVNNGVNNKAVLLFYNILKNVNSKTLKRLNTLIAHLQSSVQYYFDSTDLPTKIQPPGVKQILEKKDGLFRQHMMGKRVNFTARTVISPDPYINTDEIGIPMKIAQKLTVPERVTPLNRRRLELAVQNGPKYPGAEFIIEKGIKRSIKFIKNLRAASKTLLKNNALVHRHMQENDFVLVNRQPTLHKPSLMAHRVRILNDKTIRLHYVNCNSYNADFDGDEMNIHLPQTLTAMAETTLASTDQNFVLSGKPMRGLVQDYITAIFILTLKNSFFTEQQFFDLVISTNDFKDLKICKPAIIRPIKFFSGKQIVQTILSSYGLITYINRNKITPSYWYCNEKQLYFKNKNLKQSKTNINKSIFAAICDSIESTVHIKNGVFLTGTLDKSQVGSTPNSLIHMYFSQKTLLIPNKILTSLSRMLSKYLLGWGISLTIDDLLLTTKTEKKRNMHISEGINNGGTLTYQLLGFENKLKIKKNHTISARLTDSQNISLSNTIKSHTHNTTSNISNLLMRGTKIPFPYNNMSNIILSGGKGSIVNFSQISGILGQQSIEGKRVPLLKNGRALNYFQDIGIIENGFIVDRFLTGLAIHSFFFHCQAGREGLIDTAVKTAKSGYLQRCLVKMLEDVKVEYDGSVRDRGLLQYVYGEDGRDVNFGDMKKNNFNENEINIIHPGESVGILAAQAIGQPSTQMTLNTFHLAGCSSNVTLGMPRLKEILMIGNENSNNIMSGELNSKNLDGVTDTNFNIDYIKNHILESQQTLKEILYYTRIIQSNILKIIFVFNKNLNLEQKEQMKNWFFKIINKDVEESEIIISETNDEDVARELKCDNFDELNKKLSNQIEYKEMHEYSNKKNKNYTLEELRYQIENNLFNNENVLVIRTNSSLPVEYFIEKMRNDYYLNNSNLKNIEIENNNITIEGCNYESILYYLTKADRKIDAKDDISHNYNIYGKINDRMSEINKQTAKLNYNSKQDDKNKFTKTKMENHNNISNISNSSTNLKYFTPIDHFINFYTLESSDIIDTSNTLGIEAARYVIIKEIRKVFESYGIEIDIRHLLLIADKMTYSGEYCAFNRYKMISSLLTKMSFESTYSFLSNAYLYQLGDDLQEPSARLVMGMKVKNGTGMFDILDEDGTVLEE